MIIQDETKSINKISPRLEKSGKRSSNSKSYRKNLNVKRYADQRGQSQQEKDQQYYTPNKSNKVGEHSKLQKYNDPGSLSLGRNTNRLNMTSLRKNNQTEETSLLLNEQSQYSNLKSGSIKLEPLNNKRLINLKQSLQKVIGHDVDSIIKWQQQYMEFRCSKLEQSQIFNGSMDSPINKSQVLNGSPYYESKKYIKSHMSVLTLNENLYQTERISKLSQLNDALQLGENDGQDPSNKAEIYTNRIAQNQDCSQMIQTASKELKSMKYNVSKIMCGDDFHIKLERNERQDIEVIEGTSQFLKIPILGKIPPLKIYIEYEEATHRSDLKVCISKKSKQPNQNNSEKVYSKPATIQFDSVDPFYLQNFAYVGLYSDFGIQFTVRVAFPKEDLKEKTQEDPQQISILGIGSQNQKQQKFKQDILKKIKDLHEDPNQLDDFNSIIEDLKRRRYLKQLRGKDQDYIARNKVYANEWASYQIDIQRSKMDTSEERIQTVLERNQEQKIQELKRKVFLLNKWNILKRSEFVKFNKEKYERIAKVREWLILESLVKAVRLVKSNFKKKRRYRDQMKFVKKCIKRIVARFQRSMKKKGKDQKSRSHKLIANTFTFVGFLKNDVIIEKSKNVILTFLKETASCYSIQKAFNVYYSRVLKIQTYFRKQKILDSFRMELLRQAWMIQLDVLQKKYMKSGSKSSKLKLKKLAMLTEKIRENYIEMYFQRQKTLYMMNFFTSRGYSLTSLKLEKYQDELNTLDKKLGIKNIATQLSNGLPQSGQGLHKEQTSTKMPSTQNEIKTQISQQQIKQQPTQIPQQNQSSIKNTQQQKNSLPQQQQQKQSQNSQPKQQQSLQNSQIVNSSSHQQQRSKSIKKSRKQTLAQNQPINQPNYQLNPSHLIDGKMMLSIFFKFSPSQELVKAMIDKALIMQEKKLIKEAKQMGIINDKDDNNMEEKLQEKQQEN
eukprot:403356364